MFTTENKDGKWWVVESRSNEFWTNARPSKQYPTLPEDASHWAALQGKMFGEGEFKLWSHPLPEIEQFVYQAAGFDELEYNEALSEHDDTKYAVPVKAIPKQAEERGDVKADVPFVLVQALARCAMGSNPTEATKHQINRIAAFLDGCGYLKESTHLLEIINPEASEQFTIVQSQPAIPASDEEGWEEVELREVIGNAIMKFSNPTATDEIIHYLKSNYHPPKRKQ